MNKTKRIEFRVSEKEYNKIKEYCEKNNKTTTELILEQLDKELKLLERQGLMAKSKTKQSLIIPRMRTKLTN